jgi:hypothetical protein
MNYTIENITNIANTTDIPNYYYDCCYTFVDVEFIFLIIFVACVACCISYCCYKLLHRKRTIRPDNKPDNTPDKTENKTNPEQYYTYQNIPPPMYTPNFYPMPGTPMTYQYSVTPMPISQNLMLPAQNDFK